MWDRHERLCTIGILSSKDSWCLVPSSSNIYCHSLWHNSRESPLWLRTRVPYVSQRYCVVIFHWRGTQQLNSATEHAVPRCSFVCSAWQSEWGFIPSNVVCCYYKLCCTAGCVLWGEWKMHCYIAQLETRKVSKRTGRLQKSYSWGTWVLNWVKWLEHESGHQP
jgi:hypothetical protein